MMVSSQQITKIYNNNIIGARWYLYCPNDDLHSIYIIIILQALPVMDLLVYNCSELNKFILLPLFEI